MPAKDFNEAVTKTTNSIINTQWNVVVRALKQHPDFDKIKRQLEVQDD